MSAVIVAVLLNGPSSPIQLSTSTSIKMLPRSPTGKSSSPTNRLVCVDPLKPALTVKSSLVIDKTSTIVQGLNMLTKLSVTCTLSRSTSPKFSRLNSYSTILEPSGLGITCATRLASPTDGILNRSTSTEQVSVLPQKSSTTKNISLIPKSASVRLMT